MDEITTLDDATHGVYSVTTASGTVYKIDLDNGYATRYGKKEIYNVDLDKIGDPKYDGLFFDDLTPDGAPMRIGSLRDATVGKNMRIDNSDEWRISTAIQSIEKVS